MPIILHDAPLQCLVAVRGHPFDRTAFDSVFADMAGISATMVDQPAAGRLMTPDGMRGFDAMVLYDMPGLDFTRGPGPPAYLAPDAALRAGFAALLHEGKGIVALHHALAGWPAWDEYGEWLGGRFLYQPAELRGRACADSGYAHEVTYTASVATSHPVTAGIPPSFPLTDELYLAEVFDDFVTPLLTSDAVFDRNHFFSAGAAVAGRMNSRVGWEHCPGSNLIGWTRQAVNSRLVYLQPGDGPAAYGNSHYRRLVENAIRWVSERTA